MMVRSSSVGSLKSELRSSALSILEHAPLHEGQERSVERVRLLELVSVLTKEELSVVDQFHEDESEHFAKVETGDHLLERLLSGLVGRLVDDDVVLGSGCRDEPNVRHSQLAHQAGLTQVLVVERVERSPLALFFSAEN